MDRQRYIWFRIARALGERSIESGCPERLVLDDAAEALLLARSPGEHLDETMSTASWALTYLTLTGVLLANDARDLWEAICACGPPGLEAGRFASHATRDPAANQPAG